MAYASGWPTLALVIMLKIDIQGGNCTSSYIAVDRTRSDSHLCAASPPTRAHARSAAATSPVTAELGGSEANRARYHTKSSACRLAEDVEGSSRVNGPGWDACVLGWTRWKKGVRSGESDSSVCARGWRQYCACQLSKLSCRKREMTTYRSGDQAAFALLDELEQNRQDELRGITESQLRVPVKAPRDSFLSATRTHLDFGFSRRQIRSRVPQFPQILGQRDEPPREGVGLRVFRVGRERRGQFRSERFEVKGGDVGRRRVDLRVCFVSTGFLARV